jgi:DNA-binding XRE family transcriptional regulator
MMANGAIEAAFYGELGRKLHDKRVQRKMSREAVAQAVGAHRNSIMRWEGGDAIPFWMLLRVCDVLCCQHFILMPAREFTWGDLTALERERNQGLEKAVQIERDPILTDFEIKRLRKSA